MIEDTRSSKVATITGVAPFESLVDGQRIILHLAYDCVNNTTIKLTLSDDTETNAIDVKIASYKQPEGSVNADYFRANDYMEVIYDATRNVWKCLSQLDTNTTYGGVSQSRINAGTDTTNSLVSAKLLRDNFYLKSEINNLCPIIEDTRTAVVAAIKGNAPFSSLVNGQMVIIKLAKSTVANATLELTYPNNTTTGAIGIKISSYRQVETDLGANMFKANDYMQLIYDSSRNCWKCLGQLDTNTYYSSMSDAEIAAGTVTTTRVVSPKVLRDNFYVKSEVNNLYPIIEDTRTSGVSAITGNAPFTSLVDGQRILLHFGTYDAPQNSTLELTFPDGTTTGAIEANAPTRGGTYSLGQCQIKKNYYVELVYVQSSNKWMALGYDNNTKYSLLTQAQINAGTDTGEKSISAKLLRDNFYIKSEVDGICPIIEDTRSSNNKTITGNAPFATLTDGQRIVLKMNYANAYDPNLKLTLADGTETSAIPIKTFSNNSDIGAINASWMKVGGYYILYYDATNTRWVTIVDRDTTLPSMSQSILESGTDTNNRSVTAKLLRDNFALLLTSEEVASATDITLACATNKYYIIGTVTNLTLSFTAPVVGIGQYQGRFTADSSFTLTLPLDVTQDSGCPQSYEANEVYEFTLIAGYITIRKL